MSIIFTMNINFIENWTDTAMQISFKLDVLKRKYKTSDQNATNIMLTKRYKCYCYIKVRHISTMNI